jgi:hypothetical protein
MSYNSLKEYFNSLKNDPLQHDGRKSHPVINWDLLDINDIENRPADNSSGLQFADVLSYSFYKAVNNNQFGMTNQSFCMWFRRRMYCKEDGRIIHNGVTIIRKSELEKNLIPHQLINIFMTKEEKERSRKARENKIKNPTSKLGEIAKIQSWKK